MLTWHGLRHTFGSLCAVDPAMDFVTLKAAMGHARITTTERYPHAPAWLPSHREIQLG